jgi:predicted AAA+ superfamily ATPase
MLAHYHAQIWNSSEFARSFGVSDKSVRYYLDVLQDTFMVRVLSPWSENAGKRLVKSPKVYVHDSGLLHALLDIEEQADLESHPKLGASFEGFALDQVLRRLKATPKQCYFWATHQGAELDLLVVSGRRRLGFEFKHTNAPGATKSMRIAIEDLKLQRLDVIHVGRDTYPLSDGIRAVALSRVTRDIEPL